MAEVVLSRRQRMHAAAREAYRRSYAQPCTDCGALAGRACITDAKKTRLKPHLARRLAATENRDTPGAA